MPLLFLSGYLIVAVTILCVAVVRMAKTNRQLKVDIWQKDSLIEAQRYKIEKLQARLDATDQLKMITDR